MSRVTESVTHSKHGEMEWMGQERESIRGVGHKVNKVTVREGVTD